MRTENGPDAALKSAVGDAFVFALSWPLSFHVSPGLCRDYWHPSKAANGTGIGTGCQ